MLQWVSIFHSISCLSFFPNLCFQCFITINVLTLCTFLNIPHFSFTFVFLFRMLFDEYDDLKEQDCKVRELLYPDNTHLLPRILEI